MNKKKQEGKILWVPRDGRITDRPPICPRCKVGGYIESWCEIKLRPKFECSQCGETWSAGNSGGKWKL